MPLQYRTIGVVKSPIAEPETSTHQVNRIRNEKTSGKRSQGRVRIGDADPALTGNAGMVTVTGLLDRLDVIGQLDKAIGPIKVRDRGSGAGQLLAGIASAQLAGQDFLAGLDPERADAAGQLLAPAPGLASTTAARLARRLTGQQWRAVESGLAAVTERMLTLLPDERAGALCAGPVTIDMDTTDVEVYGRQKDGVAYNYEGRRVGRPHVATWAETETVLAADLGSGVDDPRATAAGLLQRALAGLPDRTGRAQVRLRADAGYFAAQLAKASHNAGIGFAIGAKRVTAMWRALDGIAETDWHDAIEMPGAQVAVSSYAPADWPEGARLLIRRVRLAPEQIPADSRSRRRRTLHPAQRALPSGELTGADAIYAYSFIATNLDVSTGEKATEIEHWHRHRTTVENIFRDTRHGAALRHLPSGDKQASLAWMWGALLAASIAAWMHQLTGVLTGERTGIAAGHGVRGGKAMIATLRRRLIAIPARLIRHARGLTLRPAPARHGLPGTVLGSIRALPVPAPG
jgi:hypothetical protein